MRRRISALALTAALAGGVVLTALPVQSATAATATCKPSQMRQDIANLRAKAKRMKHEGEPEAARRANAQADAIEKRLNQCLKTENESSKRWS
ncbi:hypothetical protein LE181_12625 [Streptomyces sp. SCA3-4]|uniref:hypothetical protein n=1 Tax=Streptomyces sichuanensis TaxID=2871810 RepID=UPI001CE24002|nr:hypothetical protein [Streptomyces sichuanensis]MCA6093002.1 hypothetical protein [Streptomyces sichuanensis]